MHTTLALTISPPNRCLKANMLNPFSLMFLEDGLYIRQVLKQDRISRYIIYPEFDKKARLHYHGILTLDSNQYIRFYKHGLHKLKNIGFIDVKKLDSFMDKLRWGIYMRKEWGITRDILSIDIPIMKISQNDSKQIKESLIGPKQVHILDYFT